MYTLYGIPNCDMVKKTMDWFAKNKIEYHFHDYKKEGITAAKLKSWIKQAGIDTIMNKRSTTWRELDPAVQALATTEKAAIDLMVENNSIIKRPVIESGDKVVAIGFKEKDYERIFPGR